MVRFTVHTLRAAPEQSKPLLERLQKAVGMIPNLAATMAESPALLQGFVQLRELQAAGTFSPGEVQVLSLTNAFENNCDYCMALHSALALGAGVAPEGVAALRAGRAPAEPRLEALSDFSRKLVRERGAVSQADLAAFLTAGFTKAQALEVVLGVAVSILPNFAHHLTQCPIDDVFRPQVWESPAA